MFDRYKPMIFPDLLQGRAPFNSVCMYVGYSNSYTQRASYTSLYGYVQANMLGFELLQPILVHSSNLNTFLPAISSDHMIYLRVWVAVPHCQPTQNHLVISNP